MAHVQAKKGNPPHPPTLCSFRPQLAKILSTLPASGARAGGTARQTLLFSATVPRDVLDVAHVALRAGYEMIDVVGEDTHDTHAHVPQEYLVVPSLSLMPALVRLLQHAMKADPAYKIMVFFPTVRARGRPRGAQARGRPLPSPHRRRPERRASQRACARRSACARSSR